MSFHPPRSDDRVSYGESRAREGAGDPRSDDRVSYGESRAGEGAGDGMKADWDAGWCKLPSYYLASGDM